MDIVMVSVNPWDFVNATTLKPYDGICLYLVGLLVMVVVELAVVAFGLHNICRSYGTLTIFYIV